MSIVLTSRWSLFAGRDRGLVASRSLQGRHECQLEKDGYNTLPLSTDLPPRVAYFDVEDLI